MEWMTDRQRARHAELIAKWSNFKNLSEPDYARIEVMACVTVEIEQLQAYVNEHGTTYQVIGKSGDTYSRARPEFQQLQELRQRLGVLLDKMTKNASAVEDELETFLGNG